MDVDSVPELGDWITIISDKYGTTSGRIIYRDEKLIRIRPTESRTTGVDFPLDADTGMFNEALGVISLEIHQKRKYPWFSLQLSVIPGTELEFFSVDGNQVGAGTVKSVIATEEADGILLTDGKAIEFNFIGSPPPYDIISPVSAIAPPENDSIAELEEIPEETEAEVFPELDYVEPASLIEEIPTEEQTFDDYTQREDMFLGLLTLEKEKAKRNPKVNQKLYNLTDLMLAMKNSLVVRDESGAIRQNAPSISYVIDSIQDILEKNRSADSLRAFVPVIGVKKVLYTDDSQPNEREDVVTRSDVGTLVDFSENDSRFARDTTDNAFVNYITSTLQTIEAYVSATSSTSRIAYDMDVLRSKVPPIPVSGFGYNSVPLPAEDLISDFIGTIDNRYVRLLSASYLRNPNTGIMTLVAPADAGEVLSHVILSNNMMRFRSPIRSSVLLWDIGASEISRRTAGNFYKSLIENWQEQMVYDQNTEMLLADFLANRLPIATSFNDEHLTSILDSLGFRNLEISYTAFEPINRVIDVGIAEWKNRYTELIKASKAARSLVTVPAITSLLGPESALLAKTTLENDIIKQYLDRRMASETTLKNYDFNIVNAITTAAYKTLSPYYYSVASGVADADQAKIYLSESRRIQRNIENSQKIVRLFQAEPDINPCEHVDEYKKVTNVFKDDQRMVLFRQFLNKYQAGLRDNYITCNICELNLVCKHEALLLNEFLYPDRKDVLHKSLLLDFGGPVFEGAYICKNCGQKIESLEYDTHLEFDDEGRPLVGRSVITEEEELVNTADVIFVDEAKEKIPFTEPADIRLYQIARTIFERCGYIATLDMYKRVVKSATDFVRERLPSEKEYVASVKSRPPKQQALMLSYQNFFANNQIGVIGALIVMEIQTTDINVPFPASGCTFSRKGVPIDGDDAASVGTDTIKYVGCVIANIYRSDEPWSLTSWHKKVGNKRSNDTEKIISYAINSLLCIGSSTIAPLTDVTDTYKTLLDEARARGVEDIVKASASDLLPHSFRPTPAPIDRSLLTEESIQNVKKYNENVRTQSVDIVGPFVKKRENQLNAELIGQFYKESVNSAVIEPNSTSSESICCYKSFLDIGRTGVGVASLGVENLTAELVLQSTAATTISRRDPAAPNCGSHIYVPWSAVVRKNELATLDSSEYYKLFLQYCYRKPRYGGVHEFNASNICRWCGFRMPASLVDLTVGDISATGGARQKAIEKMNAERTRAAIDGLSQQGIVVDKETFEKLENAMKNFKAIVPPAPLVNEEFSMVLQKLGGKLDILLPNAADEWAVFIRTMDTIRTQGLDDIERKTAFNDFSRIYTNLRDSLVQKMARSLGENGYRSLISWGNSKFDKVKFTTIFEMLEPRDYVGSNAKIGATAELLTKMFNKLTTAKGVGSSKEIVDNLLSTFVKQGSQIRNSKINAEVNGRKWVYNIAPSHFRTLLDIWDKSFSVVTDAVKNINNYIEDDDKTDIEVSLDRYTTWFGSWLTAIGSQIRINVQLTPIEFQIMTSWVLFSGLSALMDYNSPIYAGGVDPSRKEKAVNFHILWVSRALIYTIGLMETYQRSQAQIEEAINARIELEKAFFVERFDKLTPELRRVELQKKKYGLGDFALNVTNVYDPDTYAALEAQREQFGLDSMGRRIGVVVEGEGVADENDHRAAVDED